MKKIMTLVMLFLVFSFGYSQAKAEKKQLKEEKVKIAYEEIKTLIDSGVFSFEADWALPLAAQRVNLLGNSNYLKIEKDSIDAFLPFFGVLYLVNPQNNRGGITLKSELENYKVSYNEKKKRATVKFNAENKTERFDIILTVHRNGRASVSVVGNNRSSISYDGEIGELEELDTSK